MRINTNISSLTAQEAAVNTNNNIKGSLEKLSTGLRINKASDDASGLAIADKLRTQATSINQGISNGNSAVTLLQIADKSMAEQSNILDTIKSKLIQANTDTTSADGRESIRKDISKLLEQLDNIAEQTNYNGNVLLQNAAGDSAEARSSSNSLSFQIGESKNDIISNTSIQSNTSGLGSKVTYSNENQNNTLTAGSSMTLASEGSINLTSTNVSGSNTSESVSLSGDIDSLTLAVGTIVSGLDDASKAAFETAYSVGTDYTQSGSTYTMLTAQTLDLSAISGTKTANITTAAESSSTYTAQVGDKITSSDVNSGSALATALGDNTKFTDNLDGTYTAKATGSYTLTSGESLDYSRATTEATVTTGQTVTLGANVVAGSELDTALKDTGKFTLTTGTAGTSGAVYTAVANVANLGIDDLESVDVGTPAVAAAATNLVTTVGDMVELNANVVANSDLATALADNTKFELVSGVQGNTGAIYKALTAETIALSTTESLDLKDATTVNIGQGSTYPAGSSLTLNANVVAGSDLANQLGNAAKFTLASGVAGTTGAVYTVKDDFTTNNVKIVEGESISMTAAQNVATPNTSVANHTIIDDATMTFTPDGGAAVNLNVSATGVVEADATAGVQYQISQRGVLEFDVTAATDADTFDFLAGDTVKITTDANTNGLATSEQITESANWIDNGDGSYTAIAAGTLTFDDATDKVNVKRTLGGNLSSGDFNGVAATPISRIDTPASSITVAGAANTTGSVAPSSTVSVSFTTSDKVNVTNNGLAANTLKVTGDGTNEVSNGGTQLNAIAAIGSGEFTQAMADEFQAVVDDAITGLNAYRGDIGSTQNQVESAVRNLMTQATNVKAAESIIRDVDYAQESANFNKQNIISQAGSYAISQANAVQQNVLRLLQ
uniref:flagellin N-terminal helical domain-containing protein n=2 Tax=Aliarcobacter sp. TaxID=2321116 RepID=UPI004047B34E